MFKTVQNIIWALIFFSNINVQLKHVDIVLSNPICKL